MTGPRKTYAAIWPCAGIVLLLAVNAAADITRLGSPVAPGAFLHLDIRNGLLSGAMVDVLNQGSKIVIVSLGMAAVIATRGVDLSVGSVMAMAGALAAVIVAQGGNGLAALAAGLGVGLAGGAWNGLLVTRMRLQPFVATLTLMVAGRGVAQLITDGQIVTFQDPLLVWLSGGRLLGLPAACWIAAGISLAALVLFRRTALGMMTEATGANSEAARLAGVRNGRITLLAYVLCGLCAAVAGVLQASNIKAADPFHSGLNAELAAIFAVVVGGTSLSGGRFSLLGAVAGGILMQLLTATMYARNISADVAPLPEALAILGVCLLASDRFRSLFRRGVRV